MRRLGRQALAAQSRAASGSCGASRRSGRGASGAGPSRKKRSRSAASRSRSQAAASFMRRYSASRRASSSAASSGSSSASSASSSGKRPRAFSSSSAAMSTRNSPHASRSSSSRVGQALDERDDDRRDVDLGGLERILEQQREQEVERALERVEVQLEIADGGRPSRGDPSRRIGRGRAARPSSGASPPARRGAAAAPTVAGAAIEHEPDDRQQEADRGHPGVDPHAGELVRGVDAQHLDPEAAEAVERHVEGEEPGRPDPEAPLDERAARRRRAGSRAPRRGTSGGRSRRPGSRAGRLTRGRSRGPRGGRSAAEELLVPPVAEPADRLRHQQARRDAVGSTRTSAPSRLATIAPTITPSPMPPQTPRPPFQIANGPHHSSGTSSQLVTRW